MLTTIHIRMGGQSEKVVEEDPLKTLPVGA